MREDSHTPCGSPSGAALSQAALEPSFTLSTAGGGVMETTSNQLEVPAVREDGGGAGEWPENACEPETAAL